MITGLIPPQRSLVLIGNRAIVENDGSCAPKRFTRSPGALCAACALQFLATHNFSYDSLAKIISPKYKERPKICVDEHLFRMLNDPLNKDAVSDFLFGSVG